MTHLKLNKTVTLKHPTSIEVACSFTGITSSLLVAALPDTIKLDYQHPLSYLSNSRKVAALPLQQLSKIEPQVLAGAALTIYCHFGLLEVPAAQDAFVSNSILRTVGLPSLLSALQLSCILSKANTKLLPHFSLDYQTHKEAASVGDSFSSYLRLLKTNLSSTEAEGSTAHLLLVNQAHGKNEIKASTRSDWDRDFDKRLVEAKQEAKELLNELKGFFWANGYEKLEIFLRSILPNRNLVALEKPIRTKLITRLQEASHKASPEQVTKLLKLIDIVIDSENPYDIFAKANDLLERASDSFVEQPRKKTLAEILAEKKAQAVRSTPDTPSHSPSQQLLEQQQLEAYELEAEEDLVDDLTAEEGEDDEDSSYAAEDEALEDTFDRFVRFEAAMTAQGE